MRSVGLQVLRGFKANAPVLLLGELYFCTDTFEILIGSIAGNTAPTNIGINVDGGRPDTAYGGLPVIDGGGV